MLTPAEELHLGAMVRAWQDHPCGPDDAPAGVRRRGLRARERMVTANLRLVAAVARRRGGPGLLEDRLQAGALGLVRAAERFDPARGYKFSTFAYWWIRQSIGREIDLAPVIRLPDPVASALRADRLDQLSTVQREAALASLCPLSLDCSVLATTGDSSSPDPLGDLVPGECLDVERLEDEATAVAALAAIRRADPDAVALLELRAEGARAGDLAAMEAQTIPALHRRLQAARDALRALPEVERVLAA